MKDPIKELAKNLEPFESLDSYKIFIVKWFFFSVVIVLMGHLMLPVRIDLMFKISDFTFELENILWFLTSFLSASVLYYSSFPERESAKLLKFPTYFALTTLFLILFSRIDFSHSSSEVMNELNLWRGRCGFIILTFSLVQASFMVLWTRKAAPNNTYSAGFWSALSASSLGCLLMQVVCPHDNSTHLLLWHFVPLTVVSFSGGLLARKFLRW
jgi:hypothetical protein